MSQPTIVAMGGWPIEPLAAHAVSLRGRRILVVATASMESAERSLELYDVLRPLGEISFLRFYPWPPSDLRELLLSHDLVVVPGGNTANMLAIWRVHGFDDALREAWHEGVVLCGWSAGAICWFEACVTDSFGPQLAGLHDGLGFLPGSACPHYDGEELRRPVYTRLVGEEGFPPGIALDDGVAAVFRGTELADVVSARDGAAAYRVSPAKEERLAVRRL